MSPLSRLSAEQIEAIPENLLREPIDYVYADHFRQRVVCKLLDDIAYDPGAPEVGRLATVVAEYMERDLPRHVADEEQDLFPLLRTRCEPRDSIESVLSQLSEEHAKDEGLSSTLLAGLHSLAKGQVPNDQASFLNAVASFAESQRRHLAWEERLVLPLARKRLANADLLKMGRSMAARRDIAFPAESADGSMTAGS
jgi:hemerythrin-like domain-containing protein